MNMGWHFRAKNLKVCSVITNISGKPSFRVNTQFLTWKKIKSSILVRTPCTTHPTKKKYAEVILTPGNAGWPSNQALEYCEGVGWSIFVKSSALKPLNLSSYKNSQGRKPPRSKTQEKQTQNKQERRCFPLFNEMSMKLQEARSVIFL